MRAKRPKYRNILNFSVLIVVLISLLSAFLINIANSVEPNSKQGLIGPYEVPMVVQITSNQKGKCTAFFIKEDTLLTAAHCVLKKGTREILEGLRIKNWDRIDIKMFSFIKQVFFHPYYSNIYGRAGVFDPYDVAVLKIDPRFLKNMVAFIKEKTTPYIEYSQFGAPIGRREAQFRLENQRFLKSIHPKLPKRYRPFKFSSNKQAKSGLEVVLIGYGKNKLIKKAKRNSKIVGLNILEHEFDSTKRGMICFYSHNYEGAYAQYGDSGGPLLSRNNLNVIGTFSTFTHFSDSTHRSCYIDISRPAIWDFIQGHL